MGSHSVTSTRHEWTRPALTSARQVGTRLTYSGGMEGWVHLNLSRIRVEWSQKRGRCVVHRVCEDDGEQVMRWRRWWYVQPPYPDTALSSSFSLSLSLHSERFLVLSSSAASATELISSNVSFRHFLGCCKCCVPFGDAPNTLDTSPRIASP